MNNSERKEKVLLVEDDKSLKQLLAEELQDDGLNICTEEDAESAFSKIQTWEPDIVISDLKLPQADAMDLLNWTKKLYFKPRFLIITAFGSIPQAVEALKSGADDFLTKPLDLEHFSLSVHRILENQRLRKEVFRYRGLSHHDFQGMIGAGKEMRILFDQIQNVAQATGPVLITGESGTGKELVAKAIYNLSERNSGPFQAINCAGIPSDLLESEFFGYEEGAFTGARKRKIGLFPRCHKGIILLDEIGEMPLNLQAKILRVLQDGSFRPVGSNDEKYSDVRVICSTNQNLYELVNQGHFRSDLYYRLETFSLNVPPLRNRKEDIKLLTAYYINKFNIEQNKNVEDLSDEAKDALQNYDYPGNVRELQNVLERAITFCDEKKINIDHLPFRLRHVNTYGSKETKKNYISDFWYETTSDSAYLPTMHEIEKQYLDYVLNYVNGNKRRAAEILGIGRKTLYRWLDD